MELLKFVDMILVVFVVYMPLLIGKSKRSEESIFWASVISLVLTIIVLFLIKTGNAEFKEFAVVPLMMSFAFGFVAYGLYKLNFSWEVRAFSPITWLVLLTTIDNVIFRKFGLYYTSALSQKLQLLFWNIQGNVIVIALLCAFIYFLVFARRNVLQAVIEGSMAFVVSIIAGHIYLLYGLFNAILAQSAFNFWRVAFIHHSHAK